MKSSLRRIRSIADYQFGKGMGAKLFPEKVEITHSKATGRIRYVYLNDKRLATLRPTDGLFSLSITAARIVAENRDLANCFVAVQQNISAFIASGRDVFAAHVVKADDAIHSKDEVVVIDENNQVLAVGRAILSGSEMITFRKGVAVKIRRGCAKES